MNKTQKYMLKLNRKRQILYQKKHPMLTNRTQDKFTLTLLLC